MNLTEQLNILWVVVAGCLVFFMQAGFMCLESGLARAKNSINIAIKNMLDFVIAVGAFWAIGFGIMFGNSVNGLFGSTDFFIGLGNNPWTAAFFMFQVVFVGTAATIDSGAVAERTKFIVYLTISFITSILIYPVFGHWAWGSFFNGETQGWLEALGFIDFAGSSVVHSVGGWVALAGIICVGPRIGKFTKNGGINKIPPHDLVMAYLGTFILFLGWFGFNAGSTLGLTSDIAFIALNTLISAAFGGASGLIISWVFSEKHTPEPEMIANGIIGGLVGITAGCASVTPLASAVIGILSGIICYVAMITIERVFRLDDVVSAVAVHGFCGAWGTLATGIFIKSSLLQESGITRLGQVGIQAIGIIVCFLWAFSIAFITLKIISKFTALRVSEEDERVGLNISEHGASSSFLQLINAMNTSLESEDYDEVEEEVGTEIGEIAYCYNKMIRGIKEKEHVRSQEVLEKIEAEKQKILQEQENTEKAMEQLRYEQENTQKAMDELNEEKNKVSEMIDALEKEKTQSNNMLELLKESRLKTEAEMKKYEEYMKKNIVMIQSSTNNMEEIINGTFEESTNLEDAIKSVVQSFESIESVMYGILDMTEKANSVTGKAVETINENSVTASELGKSVEHIEEVLSVINDIAEKTNLLSLNASIEAARAGDQGAGFAVVASEIKVLADKTASNTKDIRTHVSNLQATTEQTLNSLGNTSEIIIDIDDINSKISTNASEYAGKLKQINEHVTGTYERSKTVIMSLETLVESIKGISRIVEDFYSEFKSILQYTNV